MLNFNSKMKFKFTGLFILFLTFLCKKSDAQIFAGQRNGPDVFYYDYTPDTTLTIVTIYPGLYRGMCDIDLNMDGVYDYQIYLTSTSSPGAGFTNVFIISLNNNQVALSPVSPTYADTLSYGDNIDNSIQWSSSDTIKLGSVEHFTIPNTTYYYGTWGAVYEKYLGLKMFSGNDTLFGYFNIKFPWPVSIKDYGINTQLIHIPESQLMNNELIAYPVPFKENLNININTNEIQKLLLYDHTSRIILQQEFKNTISLNTLQLTRGIYYVEVRDKYGINNIRKVVKID